MAAGTESLDAELLKDLRGLGKPPSFDGNDAEVPRLSIQLQNTHEPRQFCFSRAGGQVRNRAKSDLPASRESAGRSTLEVLHADVLCIGLDNEWQYTNPDQIRGGNQRS